MLTRRCPSCGLILPENRLAGFCPACTWQGLSLQDDDDPAPEPAVSAAPLPQELGRPRVSPASAPALLMRLPGYEIIDEVARGGMGIVYRARQLDPARTVALKMLLPHQLGAGEGAQRFRVEIQALAELEHPAILPVYEVGEHDGLPYFTMKLATGGTLAQRKARFAGKWREIAGLMATLAEAVHFAHEHAVLHRDIKPGNVLFDEAGRIFVSDFGLAKLVTCDSDLTRSADFLGTPHYVAPEVASTSARQATTASDIYSLGAILYELLTGHPPFTAEGIPALLRKIVEEQPVRPSIRLTNDSTIPPFNDSTIQPFHVSTSPLPRDLEIICLKCLEKNPERRYPSARELAEDLRRWLDGRAILARPATRFERVAGWTRRNPALASLSAILLIVLAAAVALQARANTRLRQALIQSLLSQAQLQRSSGRAGQRFKTLSLIDTISPARAATPQERGRARPRVIPSAPAAVRAALRTEVAAALALPDMRPLSHWPVPVTHFENAFDFTPDLEHYVAPLASNTFALYATATRQPVWRATPDDTGDPVIELRVSPNAAWVAARFQNGHIHLYNTSADTPVLQWRDEPGATVAMAFDPSGQHFAIAARDDAHTAPSPSHAPSTQTPASPSPSAPFTHKGPAPTTTPAPPEERGRPRPRATPTAPPQDRGRPRPRVTPSALQLWNLPTRELRASIPQPTPPAAIAFNTTSELLAVASDHLAVWHLPDAKLHWSTPLDHGASALAWSPDDHLLAVALDRRLAANPETETPNADPIFLFDAQTGKQQSLFAEARSRVQRLAFHPDSASLAAAAWNQELIWGSVPPAGRVAPRAPSASLVAASRQSAAISASLPPVGFRLLTEGAQRALTFHTNGLRLGYNPTREELGLMEVVLPTVLRDWQPSSPVARDAFTMSITSDARFVATATDTRVHLWDAQQAREIAALNVPGPFWWLTVLFAPGDDFLYYSAYNFGVRRVEILRTNTPDGRVTLAFGHEENLGTPNGFIATSFAADGRSLIVGQNRRRAANDTSPPTIWLWPDADPARARKLAEDFPLVGYRAVPGGTWGVTTDLVAPDVWIWDFATGERKRQLGIPLPVNSEPTANGRWLITRTTEEVSVWEVGTWRKISSWPSRPEEQGSTAVVSSPDSRLAGTKTSDGRIVLRNLPDGAELLTLTPPRPTQIVDWQFTQDGAHLFVLGRTGRLYEWKLAELRTELAKHGLDW